MPSAEHQPVLPRMLYQKHAGKNGKVEGEKPYKSECVQKETDSYLGS
jgi:hypothetical protein